MKFDKIMNESKASLVMEQDFLNLIIRLFVVLNCIKNSSQGDPLSFLAFKECVYNFSNAAVLELAEFFSKYADESALKILCQDGSIRDCLLEKQSSYLEERVQKMKNEFIKKNKEYISNGKDTLSYFIDFKQGIMRDYKESQEYKSK